MNTSCFRISRDDINLAEDIKLLGVTLDKDLNFESKKLILHVTGWQPDAGLAKA